MKRFFGMTVLLLCLCATSLAWAHDNECKIPPGHSDDKGQPNKPEKVSILHCGCADTGDMMHYVEIMVSSKSKGHKKHVAGSIDSCSDGSDNFNDFVRSGSDCQLTGTPIDGMDACTNDQMAASECGTAVID